NATNPLSADMIDLKPVMTWKTEIVHELNLSKGQAVSYGGRWVAPKDARIAVLPVGYADGFVRNFTNVGIVLINGKRFDVVGTVCMDYTMIDISDLDMSDPIGAEVILLGSQN